MLISIVIPTYNEEKDIERTLRAALAQSYREREILVVDDSSDRTPEIVARFEPQGVRLIRRPDRDNGCCGAKNLGIREAKGDVVVLLNADVVLAPDFLERIAPEYAAGADFVVVESKVLNQESLYARYVGAAADAQYANCDWLLWSEGFSCRRAAALDAGLVPGDYPVPFCRDWLIGLALLESGYRKRLVRDVVAHHVAPATLPEFWRVRRTRGRISALFKFFVDGVPLPLLPLRILLKNVRALGGVLLVAPVLAHSVRAAARSPRGLRDVPGFWVVAALERVAGSLGEWAGLLAVLRATLAGEVPLPVALGSPSLWRKWLRQRRQLPVRG